MKNLNKKALGGLVLLLAVMAVLLFVPAWTLDFWQAWVFLAVFGASSWAITFYLIKQDPQLLARRMQAGPTAEKEISQKIIQSLTFVMFVAMLAVPALDHRLHRHALPFYGVITGDVLVGIGFLIVFFVYKENTFASAIIECAPDQKVISTGLYARVRHPMYMGGILLLVGMALALGSWSGLFVFLLFMPALIWRIFDEERFLAKNLPGYRQYQQKVKYRLLPFIW
ncbi:MAG TPA: isoprenylcysteine carboxylmethyltransferase family protein [Herbaspirillum sp.]|jgi:protein-S-isoprenylcysteine O-methyltransferase Ste14|nr:isoprenylcysteine carboxylmethyltransferase family protein [Herbaspirillum sp.]